MLYDSDEALNSLLSNDVFFFFFFKLQMLNSFASDLDSILSDLSTSPTLRGSQELVGSDGADHAASCPDLVASFTQRQPTCGEDVVDSSDIPLLERLIRSHPIWYLPSIQRVAAAQLLQNQEQGVNIYSYVDLLLSLSKCVLFCICRFSLPGNPVNRELWLYLSN